MSKYASLILETSPARKLSLSAGLYQIRLMLAMLHRIKKTECFCCLDVVSADKLLFKSLLLTATDAFTAWLK